MRYQTAALQGSQSNALLKRLLIALTIISALGLGLWGWIQQNQNVLPIPDSNSGRALLRQYQGLTHDIWLVLLLLTAGYLINRSHSNKQQEANHSDESSPRTARSFLKFANKNPITTILFISYTIAMIAGTTYLYKDMVGWYPDLIDGHFLDNFSLRRSFIDETMRRTDYRFFPLAHQDIHILSWFSIQIKTWMLFSAAELIGIVLLCIKFLNNLTQKNRASTATILFVTSLLLIHPSTGTTFFHVIYCERMLCLVFMLYINAYLDHTKTQRKSSFYSTLLWALIGIYIKDIAILLFVIPPACLWAADAIRQQQKANNQNPLRELFNRSHQLEHWLCSLTILFICSYIFLALIPSSYAAEGAYNEDTSYYIFLDFRFYLFSLIATARMLAISQKRIEFGFLDSINLSAFAYAFTLAIIYEFDSSSYLALPFQLIATINIGWAWIQYVGKNRNYFPEERQKLIGAILASTAIITTDHATSQNSFIPTIKDIKFEQLYIQSTYEKLHKISREIRTSGDDVNIIINKNSRLSAKRHLGRIPYKSLIEYMPEQNVYIIKDGAGKGSTYIPKAGDIVANLDKRVELIEPILENYDSQLIYRSNSSDRTGVIRRIIAVQQ